uniref:Uncharacterized protein MANES_09G084000 n=1 Tax=Rhizophora mucronata TaxID=61149 RepID=A0A2P2LVI2_RHIMU
MAQAQNPIPCSNSLDSLPSQVICFVRFANTTTKAATCALITHITACASPTHAALATLNIINSITNLGTSTSLSKAAGFIANFGRY